MVIASVTPMSSWLEGRSARNIPKQLLDFFSFLWSVRRYYNGLFYTSIFYRNECGGFHIRRAVVYGWLFTCYFVEVQYWEESEWPACFTCCLAHPCVVKRCLSNLGKALLLHLIVFSFFDNLRIVDQSQTFWWPSEPRARTAWAKKKRWYVAGTVRLFLFFKSERNLMMQLKEGGRTKETLGSSRNDSQRIVAALEVCSVQVRVHVEECDQAVVNLGNVFFFYHPHKCNGWSLVARVKPEVAGSNSQLQESNFQLQGSNF